MDAFEQRKWTDMSRAEAEGHAVQPIRKMVDQPSLEDALEDAIWQALDSAGAMPHSGADPAYVIPELLRLLDDAGYTVTRKGSPCVRRNFDNTCAQSQASTT